MAWAEPAHRVRLLTMRAWIRLCLAGLLGLSLLVLVLPYSPGHAWFACLDPRLRTLISLALVAAAAWAIPPRRFAVDARKPDALLLGVGLLLLIEPLLHLILLAWATRVADPSLLGLVLPPAEPSASALLAALPLTVLLPPLIEEWCFRGRLFGLVRERLGPINAITISALAFAVAHGTAVAALVVLPLGLLLGVLRLAGRGLGPCILVHAVHNCFFLLISGFASVRHLQLILCVAGVWLLAIALGWQYLPQPRHQRRILMASSLLMGLAFLLLNDARRLHDRLWLAATAYQLAHPHNPVAQVRRRLAPWQSERVLDEQRRRDLAELLLAGRWPIPPERLLPILAELDPDALLLTLAEHPERARATILSLAELDDGDAALSALAQRICLHHRSALAAIAEEQWELLPRWLPAEQARGCLVALLAETQGPARTRLLAHIGEAYGREEPLACLLALPAKAVQPRDRLWLFKHCADPEALLRARFATDPERARAWSVE